MSSLNPNKYGLDTLQKISMSLMGILVLLTFVGANLQAVFWQSSNWLVSTVLPAVVVDLTNQERADVSAQPLRRSAVLDASAKMKAEDMAKNEYFAHFSPTGVSPWYWFDKSGYVYAYAGENLAIHFTDSSEVVEAWMNSPAHRENIVNGKYSEIGVGTAKGKFEGFDTVYVVQLFGTPALAPVAKSAKSPAKVAKVTPVEVPVNVPAVITESPEVSKLVLEQVEVGSEIPVVESVSESVDSVDQSEQIIEMSSENTVIPVAEVALDADLIVELDNHALSSPTDEVVVIETPAIATSSGLAVANITTPNNSVKVGLATVATQPSLFLQYVYLTLGLIVLVLLTISIVMEARRFHYAQVAYGFVLLAGMGGLWFVNSLLTSGAVIL